MAEIAVALSGGVDSSVAAALLVQAGRDVLGVTMHLGLHSSDGEVEDARRVCASLGIRHEVIDLADEFRAQVVGPFAEAYASGLTPNPCITCNERIKFGVLARETRRLGATSLATGHYANLVCDSNGVWLERASDATKDQSYFMYRVSPEILAMLEFPLGGLLKDEVRRIAIERGLPTADRRDSQEVCFTGDHRSLVGSLHPETLEPGPIEDLAGTVLGTHRGIARYTVGQRKGLGVGGPEGPYRVVRIDAARNAVIVGAADEMAATGVTLADPVWRLGTGETRVLAQVRYRSMPVAATASASAAAIDIVFDSPLHSLAPGQSVVLYSGNRIVGGGIAPPT
ncbi:MAG: tRNA 2-thiouridine(34) synthase MnmA [Coriobacteriia bacterium]|nr:tRNA 2-thiouridine(34) synthase MnmA [Coriobacteriia bacterium]